MANLRFLRAGNMLADVFFDGEIDYDETRISYRQDGGELRLIGSIGVSDEGTSEGTIEGFRS